MTPREIYDKRNAAIKAWGRQARQEMLGEIAKLNMVHGKGILRKTLHDTYINGSGIINGVGFRIPRHAVFAHKGVGRGYPIEKTSLGNTLLRGRQPKPFLNPVLDRLLPQLADEVSEYGGDIYTGSLFIK